VLYEKELGGPKGKKEKTEGEKESTDLFCPSGGKRGLRHRNEKGKTSPLPLKKRVFETEGGPFFDWLPKSYLDVKGQTTPGRGERSPRYSQTEKKEEKHPFKGGGKKR